MSNDPLADRYFIKGSRTLGSKDISHFFITPYGFQTSAHYFLSEFDSLINQILVLVINKGLKTNEEIVESLGKPKVLIDYILDILQEGNYIKIKKVMGGLVLIFGVTVQGERAARNFTDYD